MKKLYYTVRIKWIYLVGIIVFISAVCITFSINNIDSITTIKNNATEDPNSDIIVRLLMPNIDSKIDNYYEEYLQYPPRVVPWYTRLISITKEKADYIVVIEVMPYIGAHITIGKDLLIYRIGPSGDVSLVEHKHIESYELPSFKKHLIKKWPPENTL